MVDRRHGTRNSPNLLLEMPAKEQSVNLHLAHGLGNRVQGLSPHDQGLLFWVESLGRTTYHHSWWMVCTKRLEAIKTTGSPEAQACTAWPDCHGLRVHPKP